MSCLAMAKSSLWTTLDTEDRSKLVQPAYSGVIWKYAGREGRMRVKFRAAIVVVFCVIAAMPSRSADWPVSGTPPETPDATANEFYMCQAKQGPSKKDCLASVKGMTASEFVAMSMGCLSIPDDNRRHLCENGVERLRPQFVSGKAPPPFPKLSAAEFVNIDVGCNNIKDSHEQLQCSLGVTKLRERLSRD